MPLERKYDASRFRTNALLQWVALIGLDTMAQLFFKTAAQGLGGPENSWRWLQMVGHSPFFWAGALCLGLTFPIWMLILRASQLNLAFPATALTYIGIVGGSQLLFGESIGAVQYAGIGLIVVGVALLRNPKR